MKLFSALLLMLLMLGFAKEAPGQTVVAYLDLPEQYALNMRTVLRLEYAGQSYLGKITGKTWKNSVGEYMDCPCPVIWRISQPVQAKTVKVSGQVYLCDEKSGVCLSKEFSQTVSKLKSSAGRSYFQNLVIKSDISISL